MSCITSLDEYFRLNFKRGIEGSLLVMFIDTSSNTLTYSGFGEINLIKYNYTSLKTEVINLPNNDNYLNDIKKMGDVTVECPNDYYFLSIANSFSSEKLQSLQNQLENTNITKGSFKYEFEDIVKNLSKNEDNSKTILYVHRKTENKLTQIKKIAENNPIAFIRSQINRRPADA